jgi:hypothetical protein
MKHLWMVVLLAVAAGALAATPAKDRPAPAPDTTAAPPPAKAPAKAPEPTPAAEPPPATLAQPNPTGGAGTRPPVGIEDLKALFQEAPLLVHFQAEAVTAKPEVAPRLVWEVRGPVVEVIKGNLLPGRMFLHVDSIIRVFDLPRPEVEGRQFVAGIRPLTGAGDRRFQLVGAYAFPVDSREADALRSLAKSEVESGAGGQSLQLTIKTVDKADRAFPVVGPKVIEVRLTNTGTDSATYLQAPIAEKDDKLYLTGAGAIVIRDTTGRLVPDKGNIALGQAPPPPSKPAFLVPNANFVENVDLAKYFNLSEGRYTLSLTLATPDLRGRVVSNGFSFQVGAVNLPGEEPKPRTEAVKLPEPPPEKPVAVRPPEKPATEFTAAEPPLPVRPAAPAVVVPDPAKYLPGKPTAGLAGLLKPAKAKFALGDPVDLEFRLINQGPRTLAIDARLERTLTVQVQEVGDYPAPLFVVRQTPWPPDAGIPEQRAYLSDGAFWGRTLNINTLYGKTREELIGLTPDSIAAGKEPTYERFGKVVYGFPKPGFYNVTATYSVGRPHTADGKQPVEQPKEWWIGDLQTNTITIQIGEPGK